MNNPFSYHARALRRARRKGTSHGKQNHPHENWGGNPVPFLETLKATYDEKVLEQKLQLQVYIAQRHATGEENRIQKQDLEQRLMILEKQQSQYEEKIKKFLNEQEGLPNENPTGKWARHRTIPTGLYIATLVILVLGEYFVTLPAVAKILNDDGPKGFLITSSFASLSVIVAHLVGISLKAEMDRNYPPPRGQIWLISFLYVFIILVVLMLSAVRSDTVQGVPFMFGMSTRIFGTVLFFVVQMAFISSATILAYFNHSEVDAKLKNETRKKLRNEKRIQVLTKKLSESLLNSPTPEKEEMQRHAARQSNMILEAQYRAIAAVYRGANLLAQSEAVNAEGHGLKEDNLLIQNESFGVTENKDLS